MNPSDFSQDAFTHASREEIISALFANMVIQQTNLALVFLGKMPHPETGEVIQEIEGAKMLIDQLEMIEAKTKGNLDKNEEKLLQQSLTALRMAFVELIEGRPQKPQPAQKPAAETKTPPPQPLPTVTPTLTPPPGTTEEEPHKRFTKKY